ncbi:MAG: LacI family DNA-binding transcriptional regulator [Pseudomonadota bacterium]
MKRGQVTSGDVARLANVSQSAVSRAFTPGASVSAATREKVMKAAQAIGYRPNALARSLLSGKSRTIALLVAYLHNNFYPLVLERLSRALQDRGYRVTLFMADQGNQDAVVEEMLQLQVEGLVMASATLSTGLAKECARAGIPVVVFNRYVTDGAVSSVTTDNYAGGRLIAEHFLSRGHQRFGYIAGSEDSSTNKDREQGYRDTLREAGHPDVARSVGGYTFAGAQEATRGLYRDGEGPDALFVANDHMAFAALDVLRSELNMSVPDDVAVIGFDNVPEAAWAAYDLTSVDQPADLMIAETLQILFDQIEGQSVEPVDALLPARLIERGTTRAKS